MWVILMLVGVVVVALLLSMISYPPPTVERIELE